VSVVVVLLLALAVGVGCGRKGKDKEKARPTPGSAVEEAGPHQGGHVKILSNEPRYLNPLIESRLDAANSLMFEGLVGLDSRFEPVPRLAEKWTLSEDGKTLTFALRAGVKWHDGQPFTSKDVKFTFDAIRAPANQSLWRAYVASVASIETPDPQTVIVKYDQPFAPAIVTWTFGIIPEHVYKGDDLTRSKGNTEPVGTGPFKLERWELGKRIYLRANDAWWLGRPHLDGIEVVVGPTEQISDMLRRGQLDFARIDDIGDWTNRAQMPEFREEFEISDVVEARFRALAWNTQRAPFDDKRVRTALTLALDRGRVIDDVMMGQARPMSAPFSPTMYGADPSIAPLPFDSGAAAKMLDEAGHKLKMGKDKVERRFAVEIIAIDNQKNQITDATFGIFRNDLRHIGVDLKLTYLPVTEYFARIKKRDFDASYFGFLPDIPDPDPYALLHSSEVASQNFAGYANAEVDALVAKARGLAARDERKALYMKVHKIVAEELPYTLLYAPFGHYAWSRRLHGVSPRDLGANPIFPGVARWWLSQKPAAATPTP
jgi:peptide/nickel transport system substrate-binding protein